MNRLYYLSLFLTALALAVTSASCSSSQPSEEAGVADPQTPVTVTTIGNSALVDSIELNAVSSYMEKNYVSANAIGYLKQVNAQPGRYVSKGQLLFTIKTKEAQSIGNTINVLDTTFKFSGVNNIRATRNGFITKLLHQAGDYVQDGEQLAIISDKESFAFLLQLPYELRSVLSLNQNIKLTLPDGEKLDGHIASLMPAVDSVAQTQGIIIKVNNSHPIPENLVAKALIIKQRVSSAPSLPKSAVLSNETQDQFWVMKLINDSTAVKVPVHKGIEAGGKVAILSPKFNPGDRIAVSGNYGLADTAKVKVVRP